MLKVSVPLGVGAGAVALLLTSLGFKTLLRQGNSLPQHSWMEGAYLLFLAAVIFAFGWQMRAYVRSLRDRRKHSQMVDAALSGVNTAEEKTRILASLPDVSIVPAPSPGRARFTLIAAQAAALGGAVTAGWYAAQGIIMVPVMHIPRVANHVWMMVALTGAGLLLSVVGYLVQHWCELPPEDFSSADPAV